MTNNIFKNIPGALPEELFETLVKTPHIHIERIISKGHITPEQAWYDQAWDEWVLLLQGKATLVFKNGSLISLVPGDYYFIPAHEKHRVSQTSADPVAVWLAIHIF